MSIRIYHQFRSTYVFGAENPDDGVKALEDIGITEWSRADREPLHFAERDGAPYLEYGHARWGGETLIGTRYVNVVRPKGMPVIGWHEEPLADTE